MKKTHEPVAAWRLAPSLSPCLVSSVAARLAPSLASSLAALGALALALATVVAAPPVRAAAPGDDVKETLTRGKLDAELGRVPAAVEAFEAVSRDGTAPAALRWEALVRLGLVRRQAGDAEGSIKAFQQAVALYGDDPEAMRFLVLGVEGVVPGADRWKAIWRDVRLAVKRDAKGRLAPAIVWPGAPARTGGSYTGEKISLTLKDARLDDVLRTFSQLTGLRIVAEGGEEGWVTMSITGVPWDEALERILDSQGLTYVIKGAEVKVLGAGKGESLAARAR